MKNQKWWRYATEMYDKLMCCSCFTYDSWSFIEMAWPAQGMSFGVLPLDRVISSDGNEVIRWELPLPLGVGIAVTWPSMGSQVSAYLGSTEVHPRKSDELCLPC